MSKLSVVHADLADPSLILDLEQLEQKIFRSRLNQENGNGSIFGGQALGQAVMALTAETGAFAIHSLHAYFLRRGDPDIPVIYMVEATNDGTRFAARRVVAVQHGRPIFHAEASFHVGEPGIAHDDPPLPYPDPESLPAKQALEALWDARLTIAIRRRLRHMPALDTRVIDAERVFLSETPPERAAFWVRMPTLAGKPQALHYGALAYMADYWVTMPAAAREPGLLQRSDNRFASLDHAMWFHAPPRVDDWILCETEAPGAHGGRGLNQCVMYDRSGRRVATILQEMLIRTKRHRPGARTRAQ